MVKNSFSIITPILTGGFLRILDIIFIGYQLIDGVNFSLLLFFPGSSDFFTLLTRLVGKNWNWRHAVFSFCTPSCRHHVEWPVLDQKSHIQVSKCDLNMVQLIVIQVQVIIQYINTYIRYLVSISLMVVPAASRLFFTYSVIGQLIF